MSDAGSADEVGPLCSLLAGNHATGRYRCEVVLRPNTGFVLIITPMPVLDAVLLSMSFGIAEGIAGSTVSRGDTR